MTRILVHQFLLVMSLWMTFAFANAHSLTFIEMGDLPYGAPSVVGPRYRTLIDAINKTDPAFTVYTSKHRMDKNAFISANTSKARAIVFVLQADVFIGRGKDEDFPEREGFKKTIGETFLPLAAKSTIPILFIHGDSHTFKFDQPFKYNGETINTLFRLEEPGANDMRTVKVVVDTNLASPFSVELIQAEE